MTSMRRRVALFLFCFMAVAACGRTTSPPAPASSRYHVTIRWTSHGVPHIEAKEWGSLGYGLAYAVATNAVCTLARELVNVRGEQSKFFGPDEGRREADIFHRSTITDQRLAEAAKHLPPQGDELLDGYVAGYNRYLADHTGDELPASCRNQPWVRAIDRADVARLNMGFAIGYGIGRAQGAIVQAAPPSAQAKAAKLQPAPMIEDASFHGSNAIALGKAATVNGRGMVLGNPHYPWSGANRFHMAHLTIPGEIDVMGVGLISTQFIGIGFNSDVAWTHTVSTALRSTLYELALDPTDPLVYRYGTQTRRLTARTVTIDVRQLDGSLAGETHTVYDSHFGPVLADAELPWTRERAFAIRDSNIDNHRTIDQYLKLARAASVADVLAALRSTQGIAWVNTIAADRHGKALYADVSVMPNLDEALIERCSDTSVKQWRGRPVLRGAPECEWRNDTRAQQAGILPAQELPSVVREDYVMNANDSHWLSNPAQPLEGYSPAVGDERTARSLRTRAGLVMIDEVLHAKERDKFDSARLQELLFNHRNYGAELALDDVLSVCRQQPKRVVIEGAAVDVTRACAVLAAWDRRQDIDSRGAQIWAEFWPLFEKTPNLWRVPFDVKEPVRTPREVNQRDPAVRAAVMQKMYSRGEWLKLPFTREEILRDAGLREIELRGG